MKQKLIEYVKETIYTLSFAVIWFLLMVYCA